MSRRSSPIAWIAPKLIGDIVTHWHKFGERRKTVAFAVNVSHSVHLRDEFIKSGVRAEHIDGATPKPERDASLARLASGEIELVTNCMVLTEGWDMPEVGCCILARPTKKMGLFRQMIGRVLRPAAGQGRRHRARPQRRRVSTRLRRGPGSSGRSIRTFARPTRNMQHAARIPPRACSNARSAAPCASPASHAGIADSCRSGRPEPISFEDGDLGEVGRDRRINPSMYDPELRNRWHAMLVHIASERGYKPGWAAYKYKEKFDVWPPWGARPQPIEPTPEVQIVGALAADRLRKIAERRMSNHSFAAGELAPVFRGVGQPQSWAMSMDCQRRPLSFETGLIS